MVARYEDDDDLPYPGYTPDGPTQITLNMAAYRRAGFDPLPGIRCHCGHTIYEAEIYVSTLDRWRPPEYFCRVCAPDEFRRFL